MIATMGKKKPTRKGEAFQAYLNPQLLAQMRAAAVEDRRTLTATFELALEAWLRQRGMWPPPEDADDDQDDEPPAKKRKT